MAHPKRRHSNTRTRTRRAHDFITPKSLSACSHCGAKNIPHRICPQCGYYKGKQRVTLKVKEDKKK
ncbi:MAG: 50S ribosomal protein L32 [Candidatus Omnitrophica bacterium]|nr:50S ribosomal protein L32 [Candidatus Omnitrophota bacterium]